MIDRFCLMIGAMKSGTTALFQTLAQHPRIAASREKEPNFFSHDEVRARGADWYRSLWDWEPGRHAWALEASTAYAKMPARPNAALAAVGFPGEFRFVYVVRDPVERIRSQYLHSLAEGWIRRPITDGVAPQALCFSNYAFQLYPYEISFGRERLLVVRHEDFVGDRPGVLRRVCAFLEIEDFAFRDPGSCNSSDLYRKKVLVRLLAERGAAPPGDAVARLVDLPFERFVEKCAILLGSAGRPVDPDELTAEIRRRTMPSPEQAAEIAQALRGDLLPFCARWGIEPWECIASGRSADPRSVRPAAALSAGPTGVHG